MAAGAILLVLALAAAVVSAVRDGGAGEGEAQRSAPSTAASGAPPRDPRQVEQAIRATQQKVAATRELPFKQDVQAELLPPDQLADRLLQELDEEADEQQLAEEGEALEVLGELPEGTDLTDLLRRVQVEQVVGFYLPGDPPDGGSMFVRSDQGFDAYTEFVLSHELVHALTDQHFDLTYADRLLERGETEALGAYTALTEGDATVLMERYLHEQMTPRQQLEVASSALAQGSPELDRAPAAIRELLLAPYQDGAAFVRALLRQGGWEAVNRAYQDPPVSYEQVLHPERYLGPTRDEPQDVTLPDLTSRLGAGWRPGADTEWGELETRVLLGGELTPQRAEAAADGWDGGRLRTFRNGERTALVLRTVWDSPGEAQGACEAMVGWAQTRMRNPAGDGERWSGDGQQAALTCEGSTVTWASAPDGATLELLLAGL